MPTNCYDTCHGNIYPANESGGDYVPRNWSVQNVRWTIISSLSNVHGHMETQMEPVLMSPILEVVKCQGTTSYASKNIFILINIWFAIRQLNKYILYARQLSSHTGHPKCQVKWNVQVKRWHKIPSIQTWADMCPRLMWITPSVAKELLSAP